MPAPCNRFANNEMSDDEFHEQLLMIHLTQDLMDNDPDAHQKRWDRLLNSSENIEEVLGKDWQQTQIAEVNAPLYIRKNYQESLEDLVSYTGVSIAIMKYFRAYPPKDAHLQEPDIVWLPTIFHKITPDESLE